MAAVVKSAVRVLGLVVLAACASGAATEEGAAPPTPQEAGVAGPATVQIMNNRIGASAFTIFIVADAGIRSQLGVIEPQETKTFSYNAPSGSYYLVAQGSAGSLNSDRFRMSNADMVTWNMQLNRVTVARKK